MNYIDLGLPSGTLWADENAEGYYTFDEAKEKFGKSLPSKEQWQELIGHCEWLWNFKHNQLILIGKNGNRIIIPDCGWQYTRNVYGDGCIGNYWSSNFHPDYPDYAYDIYFSANCVLIDSRVGSLRYHVRQIKNK